MSTDAVEPDENYRTDLSDGRCTNHPDRCMIPGCDHTIEPQLSLDRARWKVSQPRPPGVHPDDQPETADLPGGGTLTMYFRRLPVTWDAAAAHQARRTAGRPASRLHECRTCGAAVADTGQHARWHVHARV